MQKHRGWLFCIIAALGLAASAGAQTASSPPPNTQFDGAYAFVSSTRVNETYMHTKTARIGKCGKGGRVGPLSIVNGQARYSSGNDSQDLYQGTVGPQGQLIMRIVSTPLVGGETPGRGVTINGEIDSNGTVRARQIGNRCSHDFVWQK